MLAQRLYSLLKHSVGFILAALIVWNPTVSQAINNATNPEPPKNHHSRSMWNAKPWSHSDARYQLTGNAMAIAATTIFVNSPDNK